MKLGEDEVRTRVRSLPPLPHVVRELRAALADESVGLDRVVDIVAGDPALAMTALRVANSPFYGVSGRVSTLREAAQILGLATFASSATTAAIVASLGRVDCAGFDLAGSWRHAVATALSAQLLARRRGHDGEAAYLGGLLHDVGRLVLAAHFPAPFAATLARVAGDGAVPHEVERALLGLDHAEVGALVAAHWRLPTAVVAAIGGHHEPRRADIDRRAGPDGPTDGDGDGSGDSGDGDVGALLDVIHVADNVTYALGIAGSADEIVPPLSPEAWQRVGLAAGDLQALFAQIEARMQAFGGALAG